MPEHQHEGAPEFPTFSLVRGAGTVHLTPCPDGDEWHWTYVLNNPPESITVPLPFYDMSTGEQATEERPWEPQTHHISSKHVVSTLSADEMRAVMGFCSHLNDHCTTHVKHMLDAMQEAHKGLNYDALLEQNMEMYAALNVRKLSAELGRLAYEALDSTPVAE